MILQGIPGYLSLFSVQTLCIRGLTSPYCTHVAGLSIVLTNSADSTQELAHSLLSVDMSLANVPTDFIGFVQPTYALQFWQGVSTREHGLTAPAGTNFRVPKIYASDRGIPIPLSSFPDCCFVRPNLCQSRPLAMSVIGEGLLNKVSPNSASE